MKTKILVKKKLLQQIDEIAKKKSLLLISLLNVLMNYKYRQRQRKIFFILHMSNSLKELVEQKRKELSDLSEQEKI